MGWKAVCGYPENNYLSDSYIKTDEMVILSFFLSWVSKTQPNHWTKRMTNT